METNEFKKMFGDIAKSNGFERAFEGWFKEFPEVIQVLDLQKSNYSQLYYLNIKIFIQGVFGSKYVKSKYLVKNDDGDISLRQPNMYSEFLNLETAVNDVQRKNGICDLFNNFLIPFSDKTNSKEAIKNFYSHGGLFILPAVKKELGIEDVH